MTKTAMLWISLAAAFTAGVAGLPAGALAARGAPDAAEHVAEDVLSYLKERRAQKSVVVPVVTAPQERHAGMPEAPLRPVPLTGRGGGDAPILLKPPAVEAGDAPEVAQPAPYSEVPHVDEGRRKEIGLETMPGLEVGVHASRYKYNEVVNGTTFMKTMGDKVGIEGAYTRPLDNAWYLRGEGRLTYGKVDYVGSGLSDGNDDFIRELRGIVGKDVVFDDTGLSFYTGYAVRDLYNDIRGLSSTGASGYRRESYYEYIPVGLTGRLRVADQGRVAANIEYDYFTHGLQRSVLGDANPALSTLENRQKDSEFAARGSLLYETPGWSFGPWMHYWHIEDSAVNCVPGLCGREPENVTTEVGFKLVRRFY